MIESEREEGGWNFMAVKYFLDLCENFTFKKNYLIIFLTFFLAIKNFSLAKFAEVNQIPHE